MKRKLVPKKNVDAVFRKSENNMYVGVFVIFLCRNFNTIHNYELQVQLSNRNKLFTEHKLGKYNFRYLKITTCNLYVKNPKWSLKLIVKFRFTAFQTPVS